MNKEFVLYEIALELRQIGFDKPCLGIYYNAEDGVRYTEPTWKFLIGNSIFPNMVYQGLNNESEINVPLYQQAFRWFRKEHGMAHSIIVGTNPKTNIAYANNTPVVIGDKTDSVFSTYEEAELACLKKLIEILKENKDE